MAAYYRWSIPWDILIWYIKGRDIKFLTNFPEITTNIRETATAQDQTLPSSPNIIVQLCCYVLPDIIFFFFDLQSAGIFSIVGWWGSNRQWYLLTLILCMRIFTWVCTITDHYYCASNFLETKVISVAGQGTLSLREWLNN